MNRSSTFWFVYVFDFLFLSLSQTLHTLSLSFAFAISPLSFVLYCHSFKPWAFVSRAEQIQTWRFVFRGKCDDIRFVCIIYLCEIGMRTGWLCATRLSPISRLIPQWWWCWCPGLEWVCTYTWIESWWYLFNWTMQQKPYHHN